MKDRVYDQEQILPLGSRPMVFTDNVAGRDVYDQAQAILFEDGPMVFIDTDGLSIVTYDPEIEGSLQRAHDLIGIAEDYGTITRAKYAQYSAILREKAAERGEPLELAESERHQLEVHEQFMKKLRA